MRLNAYIAKSGFCARRKAAILVKEGKVKVGGKVVKEPYLEVKEGDVVTVAGRSLRVENPAYFMINKPRGLTSTAEDKFAEKKITDVIPRKYGRLYPIGRLDKDSRGLIILTNDGEFCYRLTHPKFEIEKEYIVLLEGSHTTAELEKIKKGVYDEPDLLKVKSFSVLYAKNNRTEVSVVVGEGKKRHIRRLFKALDLNVLDLKRVRIGNLKIGGLPEGAFRQLNKEEAYRMALGENKASGKSEAL